MKFKRITVDCSSISSESVAYALNEMGSLGEVFDDYNDIRNVLEEKRWDYADATLFNATDKCTVSGFFTTEIDDQTVIDKISDLRNVDWADFSDIGDISVDVIDSAEWENEWKKYYQPFKIGRIVVVPEWIDHKATVGESSVLLNPGLAFGTGTHETTSMCIDLMQRIELHGKSVLDFGCGSGILGICATALGAESVLFADTDEQAITATKYNCRLNGIPAPNVLQRDVREISEPADVVIANITADVLISVEPVIRGALKKGGYAVISGIITSKIDEVTSVYDKRFKRIDSLRKNEWSAFLYKL